ncbi:MAG TPA: alpha-ketoacid dehydrogenase subunit beta [Candidatus Elarobacter sp.]|nr:alpha-ketoacid dehydrogenase subunit beta [Candidatus Elarobacter sp.]
MAVLTMVQAIRAALDDAMAADPRVMVLGEDVGALGGVFRATDGLQAKYGESRVVDMPLAEASIVGAALGLAVSGMRPVAEIQFLGFAHQAFHQIGQQVARMRFRSQGRCGVPLVLRAAFGGGVRTPELHSDAFEAFYAHSPGLKVVMPSTAYDAKGLLATAIDDPDPVLFCEPLRGYRLVKDEVPDEPYRVPFGAVRIARDGSDVTLIAWSAAVQLAERAADALQADGVSAQVVDVRTLCPLDVDGLADAVARTGRCVVVHEAPLTGGFGAEIVATLVENVFYDLHAPIERVAAPDTPYPLAAVEEAYVPSVDDVVRAARRTLEAA